MIEIEARAWDLDGLVTQVEFFADGQSIGVDMDRTDGWTITWLDVSVGQHSLEARATDDRGAMSTSPPVEIHVQSVPCRR
jgi:hypothetical protein